MKIEIEMKESRLKWGWCLFLKKEKYPKSPIGGIFDEAVARRIVACVNACEGIETELLTQNARLLDALKAIK